MQANLNCTWSIAMISDFKVGGGGRSHKLIVTRSHNAKGLRLRIDPRDASLRLSIPARASLRRAMAWVGDQRAWIEHELARLPAIEPIRPGVAFMFAGGSVRLVWHADGPRTPRHVDGAIEIGGPLEFVQLRLMRYLRSEAWRILDAETRALAARHGLPIGYVAVGDARSRWGSCSAQGDIRYSWRLILAPDFVRKATVAHEVAHLVHMDHSPAFHALAAQLCEDDPTPARKWLREHGSTLHGFGASG